MVYTTWAKEDVSFHLSTYWKSFAGSFTSEVLSSVSAPFGWNDSLTALLFIYLLSCCSVHIQKVPFYSQQVVLKNQMTNLNLTCWHHYKERSHKLNFDCSEIIWEWIWVVCIRISADVLLLLFAQYCSPLLMRKSGIFFFFFFACMWIMIPAFSRRFHKYLFGLSAFSCRPLCFSQL